MEVQNLPPAASLYLTQGDKTRHRELMRITFFDLVARGYLATRVEGNETRVGVGHALPDAALKPFERLFLKPFERDSSRQLPMVSYIRLVGSYLPTTQYFMDKVWAQPELQGVTTKSWWSGKRKLTARGEALRSQVQSRVQQVEQQLHATQLGDLTRQYGGFLLLAAGASMLFYDDFRQYRSGAQDSGSDTWLYSSALYSGSSDENRPEGDGIQDSWSDEHSGGDSGNEGIDSTGTDSDSGSDSTDAGGGDSGCSSGCGGGCGGGGD